MTVECGTSLKIEDVSSLGVYRSSAWGERCFCKTCGSTLFWRMQDGTHQVVSAQAFDDPGLFHFDSEIYVDENPGNYAFSNRTEKLTGPEFLAKIAEKK